MGEDKIINDSLDVTHTAQSAFGRISGTTEVTLGIRIEKKNFHLTIPFSGCFQRLYVLLLSDRGKHLPKPA